MNKRIIPLKILIKSLCFFLSAAVLLSGLPFGGVSVYAEEAAVLGNTQKDFTPVLRFAVTSDVHVRGKSSGVLNGYEQLAAFYTSAYHYSEAQEYNKLDGIFFIGDNTQTGSEEEQTYFFNYLKDHTKDGTYVRAAMGNHEFKATGKNYADPAGATAKFLQYSGYESEDTHFMLGGYHFIMLSPDLYDKVNAEYFTDPKIEWLKQELDKAVADTPDKPVFVMQHQPPRYTMNGSHGIAGDADLTELLSNYPQVIDFSGHTHSTITDPRIIWQDTFTALNTASLCYLTLPVIDADGNQISVKATDGQGSYVTASLDSAVRNAGLYYIVEIDANDAVRVLIYNMFSQSLWGEPFLLDTLDPAQFVYTDDRIHDAEKPVFPAGSALQLHSNNYKNVLISLPHAVCKDVVQNYRVETYLGSTLIDTQYRLSGANYGAACPDRVKTYISGLEPYTTYTVKVYATSSWALHSEPLTMEFTTGPAHYAPEADVMNVAFHPDGSAVNTVTGLALETSGNPTVIYDEALGQYVADFDGVDDAYSYMDMPYWYDGLGTGLTLETYVWLDKKPSGANMNPLSNLQSAGFGFLCDTSGNVKFYNKAGTATSYVIQSAKMTVGQWVHLIGTYDGSYIRFYVDGQPVAETAASGNVTAPQELAQMMCIGADSAVGTCANYFDGKVASAKLYSKAMTQEEVSELYNWTNGGGSATECPDHENATAWAKITAADWVNGGEMEEGHYVLTEDISLSDALIVTENTSVCIDLNGFDITATGKAAEGASYRVFENKGNLTVLDSAVSDGVISGGIAWIHGKTIDYAKGGNIYNAAGAVFTLYDGVIAGGLATTGANAEAGSMGGNIHGEAGSVINIKGGTVADGRVTKGGSYTNNNYKLIYGGNISSYGTVNISGGTVTGGKVSLSYSNTTANRMIYLNGGNIAVLSGSELNISGGVIADGLLTGTRTNASAQAQIYGRGGNLYISGAKTTISGGSITGGSIQITAVGSNTGSAVPAYAKAFGGSIYVFNCTMDITGGRITGGSIHSIAKANSGSASTGKSTVQAYGGNFYITDSAVVNMTGGAVTGGVVYSDSQAELTNAFGGNFHVTGTGILNASGGTISDGVGGARGGNILVCDEGTVNLNGDVVVTGGNATNGSNASAQDSASATLNIRGNAQLIAPKGKNSVYANTNAKVNMYSGTVLGGLTMSATTAAKQTEFNMYGGYVETLSKTDALPIEQVILYNGKLGCDPAGKATLSGCACLTDNGDGTYHIWHVDATNGSCEICATDYTGIPLYTGTHSPVDNGSCSVCGRDLRIALCYPDGTEAVLTDTADAVRQHLAAPGSYIKLIAAGLAVNIPNDARVSLDLNGKTVQITGSGTLLGMDSTGDAYELSAGAATVADTVTVVRDAEGANGNRYVALAHDGIYSFHRLELRIAGIALRPGSVGVYYTSFIRGDARIQESLSGYGVVLSAKDAPAAANGSFTADCSASSYTDFQAGADGNNVTGTLLDGILKKSNSEQENRRNASMPIYGNAYLKLKDGTILLGQGVSLSLRDLVLMADEDLYWQTHSGEAIAAMAQMYREYASVMGSWSLPNLKAADK